MQRWTAENGRACAVRAMADSVMTGLMPVVRRGAACCVVHMRGCWIERTGINAAAGRTFCENGYILQPGAPAHAARQVAAAQTAEPLG
jgi:hypothetical protein